MALSKQEVLKKLKDQTLTLKEAAAYVKDDPNSSQDQKTRVNPLLSSSGPNRPNFFEATGLSENLKYSDLTDVNVLENFDPDYSDTGQNRWGILQALEKTFRPLIKGTELERMSKSESSEDVSTLVYPTITNKGNYAQQNGFIGVQKTSDQFRPMSGLIPLEQFDDYYTKTLEQVSDRNTQLAMMYHRNTGIRVDHLVGTNAIKASDVTFEENAVRIASAGSANKRRPEVVFPEGSPAYDVVKEAYDAGGVNLFKDVNKAKLTYAFDKGKKYLLENHLDKLPIKNARSFSKWINTNYDIPIPDLSQQGDVLVRYRNDASRKSGESVSEIMAKYVEETASSRTGGVVTSPSLVRSAVFRSVQEQFGVTGDALNYMFGHVGKDQAQKAYTGYTPENGSGEILGKLSYGAGYDPQAGAVPLEGGQISTANSLPSVIAGLPSDVDPELLQELTESTIRTKITDQELQTAQTQTKITEEVATRLDKISKLPPPSEARALGEKEAEVQLQVEAGKQGVLQADRERKAAERDEEKQQGLKLPEGAFDQLSNLADYYLRSAAKTGAFEDAEEKPQTMGDILNRNFPEVRELLGSPEAKAAKGVVKSTPVGKAITAAEAAKEVGDVASDVGSYVAGQGEEIYQQTMQNYGIDEDATDQDLLKAIQDFAAQTKGYK